MIWLVVEDAYKPTKQGKTKYEVKLICEGLQKSLFLFSKK